MDRKFITKFLKGSASTSIGTMATIIVHFLSISILARLVTQEELGLYFLVIAIANGGKILASLGLDLTLVQFLVSEEKDVQQETFAAIIWIRIAVLIFFAVVVYFLGGFALSYLSTDLIAYRWLFPLLFALFSFRELFLYLLQGLQQYKSYAYIQTGSAILKFALIAGASRYLNLPVLLTIEVAVMALSLSAQFLMVPLRALSTPKMMFHFDTVRRIFKFGVPLYINSIVAYISNYGSVYILGVFLTPLGIAAYEVAKKLPQGFSRLFNSFRVVYFPSLSSLFSAGDKENAQVLMNKSLILLASLSGGLVLFSLLFRYEIITILFSERYLEAQATFVLLMLAVCMKFLSNTLGYSLVSAGKPQHSTRVNLVAIGTELLLNILLIPVVGYIGAAIAFVVMTILSQILSYFYLRKSDVIVDVVAYSRPLLFMAAIAGLYWLTPGEYLISKISFLILYAVLCLVFVADVRQALNYLFQMTQNEPTRA